MSLLNTSIFCWLAFVLVGGEVIVDKYCSLSKYHILCKSSKNQKDECPKHVYLYTLDDTAQRSILTTLNRYRSDFASGKPMNRAEATTTAANMMKMKWDSELALAAEAVARKCSTHKDCPHCLELERFPMTIVEDIQYYPSNNSTRLPWKRYLEKLYYKDLTSKTQLLSDNIILQSDGTPRDALLWAETYLIGCSLSVYAKQHFSVHNFVCALGPVGPKVGEAKFIPGSPCSSCPLGSTCLSTEEALCECVGECFSSIKSNRRFKRQDGATATATTMETTPGGTSSADTTTAAAEPPPPADDSNHEEIPVDDVGNEMPVMDPTVAGPGSDETTESSESSGPTLTFDSVLLLGIHLTYATFVVTFAKS